MDPAEPAMGARIAYPSPHMPRRGAPQAPHGPDSGAAPVRPTAKADSRRVTCGLAHDGHVTPLAAAADVSSSNSCSQAVQR